MLEHLTTLGHVKWFTENTTHELEPIFGFAPSNPFILAAVGSVAMALLIAFILDKKIPEPSNKFLAKAKKIRPSILRIFHILLAVSIIFASYRGAILQPHYTGSETANNFFRFIEIITGLLLISGRGVRLASIMLLITCIGTYFIFGIFEAVDYINLIGISIFVFLEKPRDPQEKKFQHLALPLLRIFTGLTLVILAFSEKLLFPTKALELVEKYNMNFMPALGFEHYTNELFILTAGTVELIFGLIVLIGWIPRINILALTCFFLASNTYFLILGHNEEALTELMGHLPVIATVIIIVVYGAGDLKNNYHK